MRTLICFLIICSLAVTQGFSQVKIGDNPQNIDASSVLELESSSRVFVITRIDNIQMNAIAPLRGALVYNTDEQCVFYYDGTQWVDLCAEENTTNVSFELVEDELVLTDSDGNTVSVPLEGVGEQSFTAEPIVNFRETIIITQTGNTFNFEVGQITGENIADSTIQGVDFAPESITQDKIAPASIGTSELQDNAVTDNDIDFFGPDAVTLNDFTNDAGFITGAQLISPDPGNAITDNNGAFYNDTQLLSDIANNNQRITDHLANDGDLSDQNERLTNAEVQGNEIVLTEGGVETRIDLSSFNNAGSDNQNLSLNGNRIEIDNGVGVDLSPILGDADTDEQNLTLNGTEIEIERGNTIDLAPILGGAGTDNQDLSLTGNTLNITNGAGVDLTPILGGVDTDDQDLSLTGNILNITDGAGVDLTPILGGVDTDDQDLSLTGNILNITDGAGVDLTPILGGVDTDDQQLSLLGDVLGIDDGNTVDLSTIDNQTAAEVPFVPYVTLPGPSTQLAIQQLKDELDAATIGAGGENPTNELQDIQLTGTVINLTIPATPGNQIDLDPTFVTEAELALLTVDWTTITNIPAGFADDIDNDTQLDEAAVDAFVANNGFLTAELDDDPLNEIQTISILGNDVTLSDGGGTITLPAAATADWTTITNIPAGFADDIDNDTQLDEAAVDAFVANNGFLTAELDDDPLNEIQTISILGNDVTLSDGGGTITLPAAATADWTTITNIPAGFADDIDNDTQLDEAAVDAFVANNGFLTAELDDDPLNEIQTISILGNDVTLSDGGGTITLPAAATADWTTITNIPAGFADDIDNDTQLDEAAVDAFVANNGFLTAELDDDPLNEIQTISILGNDVTLSDGGGTITLPAAATADWTTITNIPAGFADDIDNDTQYAAGTGLALSGGNEFSLAIPPNSISQGDIGNNAIGPGEIQSNAVSSDEIEDNSIVNGDIAAGAAIDGSKINPVFTQDVTTTGDFIDNGVTLNVPDFVFEKYYQGVSKIDNTYEFKSLREIESFIKSNHHLPGIKSATEIKISGQYRLTESSLRHLEKIEELFLHTIEQEKKIDQLKSENEQLSKELKSLKTDMELIKTMLTKKE